MTTATRRLALDRFNEAAAVKPRKTSFESLAQFSSLISLQ